MEVIRSRKVMIVEGNPDGHRLSYVSLLASAALAMGDCTILATSTKASISEEWNIHLGGISPLKVSVVEDFTLRGIATLANEVDADHVVIPDGDQLAYQLARGRKWTGRGTLTVLVMREKGQPLSWPGAAMVMTFVKRLLLLAANRKRRVDIRILKSATWRGYSLLPIIRDPVVLADTAGEELPVSIKSLERAYYWFGVVGKVGRRKNLPLVAAAVAALNRPDVALLIAGEVEPEVMREAQQHIERIRQLGGQVEIVNRLLTDVEIDWVITNLDCIVLAHSNEGPSGILGKAVAAGTRIVAAGATSLRADCGHIGAGAEWVSLKQGPLSSALARATVSVPPEPSAVASAEEFVSSLLSSSER